MAKFWRTVTIPSRETKKIKINKSGQGKFDTKPLPNLTCFPVLSLV